MVGNSKLFRCISGLVIVVLVVCCFFPFAVLIMSSITSESELVRNGYSLFPKQFGLDGYLYLFKNPDVILRSFGISILVTLAGTLLSLAISVPLAYGLSISGLPGRNIIAFYLFFTMLFNGGTVANYMMWTRIIDIKDTLLALLVPKLLLSPFYVIVMRTYLQNSIPGEVTEAARIDGAKEPALLVRILLPMSIPILATVGLMTAIGYWNDWVNGLYYITNTELYSLQQILNRMIQDINYLQTNTSGTEITTYAYVPTNSVKMAIAAIAALPLMIVLPFTQKYFIKGLTIGSVKG